MSGLNRTRLVELLERLSGESDEDALAAAREANRLVAGAGTSWGELLGAAAARETPVREAASAPAAGDQPGDLRLVERLLARKDISDTLRSDLEEFRRQIAAGTLDAMDADYIRALAKRMG